MITADDWRWLSEILVCPDCRGKLTIPDDPTGSSLRCHICGTPFLSSNSGDVPDLRGRKPRVHSLNLRTGAFQFRELWRQVSRTPPDLTYEGPVHPRTCRGFLSVIQDRVPADGIVVDIGCGAAPFKPLVRGLGYRYLGLDYGNTQADALADAHSLPLCDGCADAVILYAVTQALENPFVAAAEVNRILKPGGIFLGTADSGSQFMHSYFHISPWGMLSILRSQNLNMEKAWISKDVLEFLGTNPGHPAVIKPFLRLLSRMAKWPVLTPRRWLAGTPDDGFVTVGSFAFLARKPSA